MKALRLPTPHPVRFWFATGFRAALRGSSSPKRSRADGGAARAWAVWSAGGPVPAGVRVDGGRVEDGRGGLGHVATPRFPSPLVKPDVRITRIRLSDWLHREAHGGGPRCTRRRRSTPNAPKT